MSVVDVTYRVHHLFGKGMKSWLNSVNIVTWDIEDELLTRNTIIVSSFWVVVSWCRSSKYFKLFPNTLTVGMWDSLSVLQVIISRLPPGKKVTFYPPSHAGESSRKSQLTDAQDNRPVWTCRSRRSGTLCRMQWHWLRCWGLSTCSDCRRRPSAASVFLPDNLRRIIIIIIIIIIISQHESVLPSTTAAEWRGWRIERMLMVQIVTFGGSGYSLMSPESKRTVRRHELPKTRVREQGNRRQIADGVWVRW